MLREGGFGDEHVKIEDRLITASLRAYEGAEREEVVALFTSFAIFPEDPSGAVCRHLTAPSPEILVCRTSGSLGR